MKVLKCFVAVIWTLVAIGLMILCGIGYGHYIKEVWDWAIE